MGHFVGKKKNKRIVEEISTPAGFEPALPKEIDDTL